MRFGISATSLMCPKNLRTRLRPVNVCCAIVASHFVARRGGPSEERLRPPFGLNFDRFRGPEVRFGNENVPNPFFRPPKRKTTRGAQGRTRSSEPSDHGLQKPEIAYLPTVRDGKRHSPRSPAFRAADPIWVDNIRDSRGKPLSPHTFSCLTRSGPSRCTSFAAIGGLRCPNCCNLGSF